MAYEDLPIPITSFRSASARARRRHHRLRHDRRAVDTAFTDFNDAYQISGRLPGRHWSDSEALFACISAPWTTASDPRRQNSCPGHSSRPGAHLRRQHRDAHARREDGSLATVGDVLEKSYNGRFHNFVRSCPPRLYDSGKGLVDRLVSKNSRASTTSARTAGDEVKFYKLPNSASGSPTAGLHRCRGRVPRSRIIGHDDRLRRLHRARRPTPDGHTAYSAELEEAIRTLMNFSPATAREEVEIRAHCIYASALSAEDVNALRPPSSKSSSLRSTPASGSTTTPPHWPHHLTRTIMY